MPGLGFGMGEKGFFACPLLSLLSGCGLRPYVPGEGRVDHVRPALA